MRPHALLWSDEKTALLRELLKNGFTYKYIAEVLNVSKNSLIGRVHRIKAAYPAGQKKTLVSFSRKRQKALRALRKRMTQNYVPYVSPPNGRIDWSQEPPSLKVSFVDLEDFQCRYVHGDPKQGGHHFCGHPQKSASSYCEFHTAVCIISPK